MSSSHSSSHRRRLNLVDRISRQGVEMASPYSGCACRNVPCLFDISYPGRCAECTRRGIRCSLVRSAQERMFFVPFDLFLLTS